MSFRKFSKLHFAKNIRNFIINEIGNDLLIKVIINAMSNFQLQIINLKFYLQTVAITSDNEATVKKACSEITDTAIGVSCLAHNLNLVVQNSLNFWGKKIK